MYYIELQESDNFKLSTDEGYCKFEFALVGDALLHIAKCEGVDLEDVHTYSESSVLQALGERGVDVVIVGGW